MDNKTLKAKNNRNTEILETNNNNDIYYMLRGARGVIVIVVGNGHGDTSSNPGRE